MDRTTRPCGWKCRQQINDVQVLVRLHRIDITLRTLQQHFVDTGCPAGVAINFKRGMSIEHVRICGAALAVIVSPCRACETQLFIEYFEGVIAIAQVSPEIDLPGIAPARGLVPSQLKRFLTAAARAEVICGEISCPE